MKGFIAGFWHSPNDRPFRMKPNWAIEIRQHDRHIGPMSVGFQKQRRKISAAGAVEINLVEIGKTRFEIDNLSDAVVANDEYELRLTSPCHRFDLKSKTLEKIFFD